MLKKLYSNTDLLLKPFEFYPGINIVLGKYSGKKETTGINGIGKSTLVRLIDYCLLSNSAKKIFSQVKYDFLRKEDHDIALEFSLDKIDYTIIRNFDKKSNIKFGKSNTNIVEYDEAELRLTLGNLFFPILDESIVYDGDHFRLLMNFYIKDDLENQTRMDPLNFLGYQSPSEKDKSIYNFYLMGIKNRNIINFSLESKEYENQNSALGIIENNIITQTGKKPEEIYSEKTKIQESVKILEEALKGDIFVDKYKDIERELIELTKTINEKVDQYQLFDHQLKKIQESYKLKTTLDTEKVKKLYKEVSEEFADFARKKLEEVIDFKKTILLNRGKFLNAKEQEVKILIENILHDIEFFEKRRSMLYKQLREKGALDSIEKTYQRIIEQKSLLEKVIQSSSQIDQINERLANLDIKISQVKKDILNDLKDNTNIIESLRSLFFLILQRVISTPEESENAIFDIRARAKTARTNLPFVIHIKIPKADALGQARLKIIVYDLMLFLNNMSYNRLPNFLIHDGVYHAIAHKTKVNTLNLINSKYNELHNFQYFVTFNEDELEIPEEKEDTFGTFDFNWKSKIVAEFEDVAEKMIFKRIID